MDLAESVCYTSESIAVVPAWPSVLDGAKHGVEGDGRVDCKEDIVRDDKHLERTGCADPPRLLFSVPVESIHEDDRDNVAARDSQRDLVIERVVERVKGDRERASPCSFIRGRRKSWRKIVWWELELR